MRRIKILVTLVLFAVAAMSAAVGNRNPTMAADYSCRTEACTGQAQCSGDLWSRTGNCAITCYRATGAPGQIVVNGSANCAPPPTTGGGGGGGGGPVPFNGTEGYCAENWWWDTNCSGPDDTYRP
jgi:hypothetical protein